MPPTRRASERLRLPPRCWRGPVWTASRVSSLRSRPSWRFLPPSKTFTGIALEGAVEASGSDFEALYNLYRFAYDDRIDEPDQLSLWREES